MIIVNGISVNIIKVIPNKTKVGIKNRKDNETKANTTIYKKDTAIAKLHAAIAKANEERHALENATRIILNELEKVIINKVKKNGQLG